MISPASLSNTELDVITLNHDRKRLFVLYSDLQATCTKEWLVRGLLGHGEASAVYGAPGSGKSVLVEDLALHVAAGEPWMGKAVRRGAVVYVALERKQLTIRRAIAWRKHRGLHDLPFAIVGGVMDFRLPATVTGLIDICKQVEAATGEAVVLVVVDTISRALCGGDENSPKDMGAIVNATSRLQEGTGAAVQWVHHIPHDQDRLRGHGALLGAMDTTISVTKNATARTATVVKANDSEEGETISFTLESVVIGEDDVGEATTAPVVVPADPGAIAAGPRRKLTDKHKNALAALTEATLTKGETPPAGFELPAGVVVVDLDTWRAELFSRGVLHHDDPNPRTAFKRITEALAARSLIGIKDGKVWRAGDA